MKTLRSIEKRAIDFLYSMNDYANRKRKTAYVLVSEDGCRLVNELYLPKGVEIVIYIYRVGTRYYSRVHRIPDSQRYL